MIRKDKWVTEERVAAECEKVLAEGTPLHAINANMIIDRLNTKGRSTVYKYVEAWRAKRLEQAILPPFVLPADAGQKLVAVFTGMLGEIVLDDRQAAADLVAAADKRSTAADDAMRGLLATLEATEKERDDALQLLEEMEGKLIDAVVTSKAQEEIAEVAKAERDAVFAKYLPWLEANSPPSAE